MEAIDRADELWDEYDSLREQEIQLHRMVEKKKRQAEIAEELVREKLHTTNSGWTQWQKDQI